MEDNKVVGEKAEILALIAYLHKLGRDINVDKTEK